MQTLGRLDVLVNNAAVRRRSRPRVAFLAGDGAAYITGSEFSVDGGHAA